MTEINNNEIKLDLRLNALCSLPFSLSLSLCHFCCSIYVLCDCVYFCLGFFPFFIYAKSVWQKRIIHIHTKLAVKMGYNKKRIEILRKSITKYHQDENDKWHKPYGRWKASDEIIVRNEWGLSEEMVGRAPSAHQQTKQSQKKKKKTIIAIWKAHTHWKKRKINLKHNVRLSSLSFKHYFQSFRFCRVFFCVCC